MHVRNHKERQAYAWFKEVIRPGGQSVSDVASIKGSDPRDLALAALTLCQIVVSQDWIATRLGMKNAANVS